MTKITLAEVQKGFGHYRMEAHKQGIVLLRRVKDIRILDEKIKFDFGKSETNFA